MLILLRVDLCIEKGLPAHYIELHMASFLVKIGPYQTDEAFKPPSST